MDFAFDDDQLELQAAAADVLAKECPPAYLRSVVDDGHDAADLWATLGRLDWPGLAIPAERRRRRRVVPRAGHRAGAARLRRPTPRRSWPPPPSSPRVVAACGTAEQRQRFLGAVAGEGRPARWRSPAPRGRWDPAAPPVEARAHRARLGAAAARPPSCSTATGPTRSPCVARSDEGLAGVRRARPTPSTAGRAALVRPALHVAEVCFDGVTVDDDRRLAGGDAPPGLAARSTRPSPGWPSIMVGACQRALDLAVEYVQEREQFGVPIGSFQAVKHKAVDMYVAIERARALAYFAALAIAEDDERRTLAASMAKAAAGDAQQLVFRHAHPALRRHRVHVGERPPPLPAPGQGRRAAPRRGRRPPRAASPATLVDDPRRPTEVLNGAADLR